MKGKLVLIVVLIMSITGCIYEAESVDNVNEPLSDKQKDTRSTILKIDGPDCDFMHSIGELCDSELREIDEYALLIIRKSFDTSYIFSFRNYGGKLFYSIRYSFPENLRFIPFDIASSEYPLIFLAEYGVLKEEDRLLLGKHIERLSNNKIESDNLIGEYSLMATYSKEDGYEIALLDGGNLSVFSELKLFFRRFIHGKTNL